MCGLVGPGYPHLRAPHWPPALRQGQVHPLPEHPAGQGEVASQHQHHRQGLHGAATGQSVRQEAGTRGVRLSRCEEPQVSLSSGGMLEWSVSLDIFRLFLHVDWEEVESRR